MPCWWAGLRSHIDGREYQQFALPDLQRAAEVNLQLARLTAPQVRLAGVAINTSALPQAAAQEHLAETAKMLGVPAVDPLRSGVDAIVTELVGPSCGA